MKKTLLLLSTVASLCAAACAGTLSADEQQALYDEHTGAGTGGSGTGTGSTTSSSTTGSGGSGPAVDMCVVSTASSGPMHTCQTAGCHSGSPLSAGLDLSNDSMTTNAKSFKDKMNVGTMGVTMAGDPTGCPPSMYKLVDSSNAMNSLLLQKAVAAGDSTTPPCGGKMPVIGTFSASDKMCLTSWVNSVIALP
jgi:hypothetical protein